MVVLCTKKQKKNKLGKYRTWNDTLYLLGVFQDRNT